MGVSLPTRRSQRRAQAAKDGKRPQTDTDRPERDPSHQSSERVDSEVTDDGGDREGDGRLRRRDCRQAVVGDGDARP